MLTRAAPVASPLKLSRATAQRAAAITFTPSRAGEFVAIIPIGLRGKWLRIEAPDVGPLLLIAATGPGSPLLLEVLLHTATIVFLPGQASQFTLRNLRPAAGPAYPVLRCRTMPRGLAVLRGCCRHPIGALHATARALLRRTTHPARALRSELAGVALTPTRWPSYAQWIALFDPNDPYGSADSSAREPRRLVTRITAVILHRGPRDSANLAASRASLGTVPVHTIGPNDPLPAITSGYIALLQAGEVLHPHTLVILAHQAERHGSPDILFADDDRLDRRGRRHRPNFKAPPRPLSLLSGQLTTGVWLIQPRCLAHIAAPWRWADAIRAEAALRLFAAGHADSCVHIPMVLTHCRAGVQRAPASVLQEIARRHRPSPCRPLPSVSLIVPSTLDVPHVSRCLGRLLQRTLYPSLEIIIVVAQATPLNPRQQELRRRLTADPRVNVIHTTNRDFNYSRVNNLAARHASGTLLCLVNDDVTPCHPDWLARLVSHFNDPAVGVAGARLLYPDRTLQHAGIVLRPDGTGEHLGRKSRARVVSREVSAVTGACLITRRDLYTQLDGLDETFASAFNDIDYCLRVRSAGFQVVAAAEATLIHDESATYGEHYRRDETARADTDRARMLERWGPWFVSDPFHSPNLSTQPGALHRPAFPPRQYERHLALQGPLRERLGRGQSFRDLPPAP